MRMIWAGLCDLTMGMAIHVPLALIVLYQSQTLAVSGVTGSLWSLSWCHVTKGLSLLMALLEALQAHTRVHV